MESAVRLATGADAEEITAIYAPCVENTAISFETTPPTVEEMARRLRNTTAHLPWVVCGHDGTVMGYAYAHPHNDRPAYQWSVAVSVYVHEQWRRREVARGLYESLFAVLRLQGVYNAYALIALPNPPSVKLHELLGFERVGVYRNVGYKRGEWHDVGHWQLSIQPHAKSPSPPTPIDDLRGTHHLEEAISTGESSIRL